MNQTPAPADAELRRQFLIDDLTRAIELMALRCADSYADWVIATRYGVGADAERFLRQRRRRYAALRRLSRSLADLARGVR